MNFSNSAANHLYIGADSTTTKYDYHSRMTFPPLSKIEGVGESRIRVTRMVLYLRRNSGGPTAIHIGCSTDSKLGAAVDASVDGYVEGRSVWHALDVTALADAVSNYNANWYIHLTGETPRLRCNGTGSDYVPYLMVTWEYAASTISGDRDEVELGKQVAFTIAPEVEGETHTLTFTLGAYSGVIANYAGNIVRWTPPLALAAEITDDETAAVPVRMTVYDPGGNVLRTELYYQTVRVPGNMIPRLTSAGASLVNGLAGCGLTGRSAIRVAPIIDMNAASGATIASVAATVTNGGAQAMQWSSLTETDAGVFSGASQQSNVLNTEGTARVDVLVTDSRGRTVSASQEFTVCAYAPPVVSGFSVERYEPVYDGDEEISGYAASDLGGQVWVNLQAAVSSVAPEGTQLNGLRWSIAAENMETGEKIAANGSAATNLFLIQDRTIFPGPVDEGSSWRYALTVTDSAGGSVHGYASVLPGHANLSLSPDKYGVAVGMIASGRRAEPKFEVSEDYRSHFYGGLYGAGGGRMDRCELYQTLRPTNPNFEEYSELYTPFVARVGPVVYLNGMLRNKVDLAAEFVEDVVTLPEWARPRTQASVIQQGSLSAVWWLRVNKAGEVRIARYRRGADYVTAAAGSQFPLTASWIAADAFVELVSVTDDGAGNLTVAESLPDAFSMSDGAGSVSIEKWADALVGHDGSGNVILK